jgi:hypothetical protein
MMSQKGAAGLRGALIGTTDEASLQLYGSVRPGVSKATRRAAVAASNA